MGLNGSQPFLYVYLCALFGSNSALNCFGDNLFVMQKWLNGRLNASGTWFCWCGRRWVLRVYQGRFTYFFGDFSPEKRSSNPSTRQVKISAPNRICQEVGGYVSVQNNKSHIYHIPHIKICLLITLIS